MPRLSLYRTNKQNDYRFLDRTISEQFTIGGTDLYIHKYAGPATNSTSTDFTQPNYDTLDPTNIQDLMFLENRDRKYDKDIYRLRGHYNVQNLDFDLSQFGLFLNNDIIFITVHYNDMIDIIGRKLMVGDVLELPHLLDYHPLNEAIPIAMKRFYQITDANYASEGFSQTWYPHLWRIKCEPLVNSQEFSDILNQPAEQDNYLGDWTNTTLYPPGYTVTFGGKTYESLIQVPAGISPPNATYWRPIENDTLADLLSTYNKNIQINNAALEEAKRLVPNSGYDNTNLYVIPTYGEYESNGVLSCKDGQPAPPINIVIDPSNTPSPTVVMMKNKNYKYASAGVKIPKEMLAYLNDDLKSKIAKFIQTSLEIVETPSIVTDTGSGPVDKNKLLSVQSMGPVTGPYGTADNTFATSDQNPAAPGFTGTVSNDMTYRADCDPRYQFIRRATPRSFGYAAGYLTGDGNAPNGFPVQAGISFPQNPQVGDYFLRIDYFPQILYRWDGKLWVRISKDVRTETGFTADNQSQISSFINNPNQIFVNNQDEFVPEAQPLSNVLRKPLEIIPPTE